jgi:hypothetical protein
MTSSHETDVSRRGTAAEQRYRDPPLTPAWDWASPNLSQRMMCSCQTFMSSSVVERWKFSQQQPGSANSFANKLYKLRHAWPTCGPRPVVFRGRRWWRHSRQMPFWRNRNWAFMSETINSDMKAIWGRPLWSSSQTSWLQIQKSGVRFLALPDFLRISESGTGSTQPHDYNREGIWMES